ncbi:radical SAM protein [Nitratiruptor tergarcus]|uniref:Wyosine [tRNA(Phe)-imidazoG37] synthetase, radical SAM superfamily n=1 Tax=Nitratiruptor tergarcus DSM 16512 TaxID=1069081 RepID=A0A1W1WS23_9BACT|nr:radical SAM protein [Nitratiruptor tergarcus]SMC09128.1 Wyosine [tRNA(Phe)-imidazoG37] synthetase, radical SAM superfamily [Nitratiruptor tergarcus DSM 16512]
MSIIFGPVNSRRFGLSLGIDLSPSQKSCTFDCLYCELEPAKPVDTIINPPSVEEVIKETQKALKEFPDVDVITITANGEPTLYPHLDELVDELGKIKKDKKLLILSNASRIDEPAIQQTLRKFDIVKLSLDSANQKTFKKIDRPLKGINVDNIIKGMIGFRKIYTGFLVIEILVVKGINDKPQEFEALNEVLQQIKPDRIDIGTIDRPPAYKVEPVSYEKLFELSKKIKNLPVTIVSRKKEKKYHLHLNKQELIELLAHRPLTQEDVDTLFDQTTKNLVNELLQTHQLQEKKVGNVTFLEIIQKK